MFITTTTRASGFSMIAPATWVFGQQVPGCTTHGEFTDEETENHPTAMLLPDLTAGNCLPSK